MKKRIPKHTLTMPKHTPPKTSPPKTSPHKDVDPSKGKITSWYGIKDFFRRKTKPHKVIMVNMELRNGQHQSFTMTPDSDSFLYQGGRYVLDYDLKYFHLGSNLFVLDYHQAFSTPIRRMIPVDTIQQTLEASGLTEVEYATNPITLERFIISKIAEGIMKGRAIDDFLKKLYMVCIIAALSSTVGLILFVFKTGMLAGISIPGVS